MRTTDSSLTFLEDKIVDISKNFTVEFEAKPIFLSTFIITDTSLMIQIHKPQLRNIYYGMVNQSLYFRRIYFF